MPQWRWKIKARGGEVELIGRRDQGHVPYLRIETPSGDMITVEHVATLKQLQNAIRIATDK